MIDVETIGSTPDSLILSYGFVPFNSDREIGPKFLKKIILDDAMKYGVITADTLQWWTKQSFEQFSDLVNSGNTTTKEALLVLKDMCEYYMDDNFKVWANGPDFDLEMIENKLHKLNMPMVWLPWNQRCVRTIKSIDPCLAKTFINPEKHNPIADCIVQINQVCAINEKYQLNLI